MTQLGDALAPHEDVLDTGTPNRLGPWSVVAVLAVLALLGWTLRGAPPQPVASPIEAPASRPPVPTPTPTPTTDWGPNYVSEVALVDDRAGFAMQELCSEAAPEATGCPRRLLTTVDGGATWQPGRRIPALADGHFLLVAVSADELMLIDNGTLSTVVRSTDGGLSWVRLPLHRAAAMPASPSGVLLLDAPVICNLRCEPTTAAWFDPSSLALHPLPTQPPVGLQSPGFSSAAMVDGDIVVAETTLTGAQVTISADGGRTWSQSRLEPELPAGQVVNYADVKAAGGGRAYVFVHVDQGMGIPRMFGYRTDDGGIDWVALPLEQHTLTWPPQAVLDGELLAVDTPGRLYLSSGGGTSWAEVASAPRGMWLTQTVPGAPILGTVSRGVSVEHYVSTDGTEWRRMVIPQAG